MMRMLLAGAMLAVLPVLAQAQIATQPQPVLTPPILPPPPVAQPADPKAPRPLDTFGDKVTRCLHHGGKSGVGAGDIDQYTRACANAN